VLLGRVTLAGVAAGDEVSRAELRLGRPLRWKDYVLERGSDAVELVTSAAAFSKRSAFIVGLGFDPRMLVGLRQVGEILSGRLVIVAVGLPGTGSGPDAQQHAVRNREELTHLASMLSAEFVPVELPTASDRRRAGLRLAQRLSHEVEADHVIVDISALPKSVYFPLVASWLRWCEEEHRPMELQVLVTENPDLDDVIGGEGTLTPAHFGGFQNGLNLETRPSGPRVWAPVLGTNVYPQLEAINERLRPTEICPVLPFPARNPRRGDNLLLEYRQLLVDSFEIESGNYIYADESNPFDLYRTLCRLHERYRESLLPLGESSIVISTHASKTLSIGVLLAAYEKSLPVVTAGPARHVIRDESAVMRLAHEDVLTCLWLQGEPYN
jgi:hypothetical protein